MVKLQIMFLKYYLQQKKMNKKDITAIILTYNEEIHIERCINSIKNYVKQIIIIDSFSNDKTIKICSKFKKIIKVYKNKFVNHSSQLNFALQKNINSKWILRIDADEIVEKNFFNNFNKIKNLNKFNALKIVIEHNFLGKRISHGGVFPSPQIRIWKNKLGKFDEKPMDEKVVVKNAKIYNSKLKIIDHNLKGFLFWLKKHHNYANKEAQLYSLIKQKKISYKLKDKKFVQKIFYYKFPIFLRPFLLFFYRYIIKKGFLDGIAGIKFNILQTLYYRLLVDLFIVMNLVFDKKVKL